MVVRVGLCGLVGVVVLVGCVCFFDFGGVWYVCRVGGALWRLRLLFGLVLRWSLQPLGWWLLWVGCGDSGVTTILGWWLFGV